MLGDLFGSLELVECALGVSRLPASEVEVAELVERYGEIAGGLCVLGIGVGELLGDLFGSLELVECALGVSRLPASEVEVAEVTERERVQPCCLGVVRVLVPRAFRASSERAKQAFRAVELAGGHLGPSNDASGQAQLVTLRALLQELQGRVAEGTQHPQEAAIVLPRGFELSLDIVHVSHARVDAVLGLRRGEPAPQVGGDQAMDACEPRPRAALRGCLGGDEQAHADEAAERFVPRGRVAAAWRGQEVRVRPAHEIAEPVDHEGIGRQQRGEVECLARRGRQPREARVEDHAHLRFAVADALLGRGVGGKAVARGQALGAQACEVVRRRDGGVRLEVGGNQLDGQRESAQLAHDLAGGGLVRG